MDTWLTAQCMARLPHFTYFSHPESSLDEFFSGEASTTMDGDHRGDGSSPTRQGYVPLVVMIWGNRISTLYRAAPHELRFMRSLSQSLGIDPPMMNGRATKLGFYHDHGRVLPRGNICAAASRHPRATADEQAASALLGSLSDPRSVRDPSKTPASSAISVTNFPFQSGPAKIQAPASRSTTSHVASCTVSRPTSTQPQSTTNGGSHSSSRYQCHWQTTGEQSCGEWIEGGCKEMWVHVRTTHGLKGRYSSWCLCRWGGCLEKLKVSSLQRHLATHLDIRWRCSNCDMIFSRRDYARKHIKMSKECRGAGCYTLDSEKKHRKAAVERR